MIAILQFLAVLALVVAALAVIIGALSPGDAFRRLATALVLLLIAPAFIQVLIRSTLKPVINVGVTDAAVLARILVLGASAGIVGWFVLAVVQAWLSRNQKRGDR